MTISEKFKKLKAEKRRRILDAALREFAENGYEQASTNRIVQHAEVGKGVLFYYFQNKKELYDYLVSYCMDVVMNDYFKRVNMAETDFIERLRQAAEIKMETQRENEQVFNFMGTFMLEEQPDLPPALQAQYQELWRLGQSLLYENIDKALFRDDVDVEKAFNLIRWSIDGYQNDLLAKLKGKKMTAIDLDVYWKEFYEYLEILKISFYK